MRKSLVHSVALQLPILFLVAIVGAVQPSGVCAQQMIPELQTIKSAITAGDAETLMSVTSDRLELALLGASRQYSQAQAGLVLKKFFQENRPRSFDIVDSTRSSRGIFLEGRIRTENSPRALRVYLRLNRTADKWTLREMLVERADR